MDYVVKTIPSSGITENRILKEKALGETKSIATIDTSKDRALNHILQCSFASCQLPIAIHLDILNAISHLL